MLRYLHACFSPQETLLSITWCTQDTQLDPSLCLFIASQHLPPGVQGHGLSISRKPYAVSFESMEDRQGAGAAHKPEARFPGKALQPRLSSVSTPCLLHTMHTCQRTQHDKYSSIKPLYSCLEKQCCTAEAHWAILFNTVKLWYLENSSKR